MRDCQPHILILGFAREGVSLARYFAHRGARVTVTDLARPDQLAARIRDAGPGVQYALGGQYPHLVHCADRIFVSPCIPDSNPVYAEARAHGLPIESMTTLFFDLCRAPIVGITGSSGKTTTTSLIGHILQNDRSNVLIGGNIGTPMLDILPQVRPESTVVLELSSFQLATVRRSPHVAVITNITPNHLDRHPTMEEYVAAKCHIVAHQRSTDMAVLNAGDPYSATFARATTAGLRWFGPASAHDGTAVQGGVIVEQLEGRTTPIMPVADVPLLGRHNVENVLAAAAVARLLDVEPDVIAGAVRSFRPPPHRLEVVAERDGVRYIDDSIATSPARAMAALHAIDDPILLIAGGRDKHVPWDDFARLVADRVRTLLLIGEAAPTIAGEVRNRLEGDAVLSESAIRHCSSLEEAVARATHDADRGDVVLLSPACASYDMFTDFEARGAAFRRAVEALVAV